MTHFLHLLHDQTNEPRGANGLLEVRKAFEYCLDRVGCAAGAGPLWLQYCALLQRPRPSTTDFAALFGTPPPGQEEAARSAAVRCAAPHRHRAAHPPHSRMVRVHHNGWGVVKRKSIRPTAV